MKRKLIALGLAVALVAVSVVSGTLAFLTDTDQAVNVFTVGNVDIEFAESVGVFDDGDTAFANDLGKYFRDENGGCVYKGIVPTNVIRKDATVSNVGNSDAYVRVIVVMNNKAATEAALTKATVAEVFTGWGATYADGFVVEEIGGVEIALPTSTTDAAGIIGTDEIAWVYYLKLAPDAVADVFDGLASPASFDNAENAMFSGLKIEIYADAIQVEGFDTADEAFAALDDAHPLDAIRTAAPTVEYTVTNVEDLEIALASGGNVTLANDIEVPADSSIEIPEGKAITINLNGNTISGTNTKDQGALIENNGALTLVADSSSVIENTTVNGGAVIKNNGTLTLDGGKYIGAPISGDEYPEYAINSTGKLTIEEGTVIESDRGALRISGETVINGGSFTTTDAANYRTLTCHTVYATGSGSTLIINGGNFENNYSGVSGASVICPAGASIVIKGGNFRDAVDDTSDFNNTANIQNYMGYGVPVYVQGGTFDDNSVTKNLASGYTTVEENGIYTVVSSDIGAAITNGATEITLASGEYAVPESVAGKSITITGTEDTTIKTDTGSGNRYYSLGGADVTFEGVTIAGASSGQYNGFAHAGDMVYENCVIDGTLTLYSNSTFKNCTFNLPADCYIWTSWDSIDVVYENCTFNTAGKAILVYGELKDANITVTGCTFNSTGGAKAYAIANQNCAAIEIDNCGKGVGTNSACNFTVTASGNTIDEDFSGEWRIKTYDPAGSITVNGVEYTSLALDGKTMTIDDQRNVTVND